MNNPNSPNGPIGPVDERTPMEFDTALHATDRALRASQRAVDTLREGSKQLRERAVHASDVAVGRIRDDPVKSVLIAAAAGALLMTIVSLVGRAANRS